jgi:ABC-type antimicrobial peptide transport system permease subunit
MSELVAGDVARTRFTMFLLGGFAAAALLLAVIGLYGVIAFAAAQRTREIGVRVALGAQRGHVLRLVLRQGAALTGAGLAIGLLASLATGRAIEGLLYEVAPTDAPTLAAVAVLLAAVGLAASYLPARRAARIDPAVALRQE